MAKKNKSKDNKNKTRYAERALRDADYRLKAFIEDLRHDPMFRHRIFYPVLYKETNTTMVTGGKNPKDTTRVQEVTYEYYLFKSETFCANGETFNAILLANGPMLPEKERLYLTNGNNGLMNRRNYDLALRRTLTFIEMLKDQNLLNFVFENITGQNGFEQMRQRFNELCNNRNRINNNNFNRLTRINPDQGNAQVIENMGVYFRQVNERHIKALLDFLIYMGNEREIVTNFSYRPMSQDTLEQLYGDSSGYNMSDEQERILHHFAMLEEALDQNILTKITADHIEYFTEELYNHYASICEELFGNSISNIRTLKDAVKRKIARSLTDIHNYTKNYITKAILDCSDNPDACSNETYIKELFVQVTGSNDPERSLTELVAGRMGYDYFEASVTSNRSNRDLAYFLFNIFKNDVEYINEMCCNKSNQAYFIGRKNARSRNNGGVSTSDRHGVVVGWANDEYRKRTHFELHTEHLNLLLKNLSCFNDMKKEMAPLFRAEKSNPDSIKIDKKFINDLDLFSDLIRNINNIATQVLSNYESRIRGGNIITDLFASSVISKYVSRFNIDAFKDIAMIYILAHTLIKLNNANIEDIKTVFDKISEDIKRLCDKSIETIDIDDVIKEINEDKLPQVTIDLIYHTVVKFAINLEQCTDVLHKGICDFVNGNYEDIIETGNTCLKKHEIEMNAYSLLKHYFFRYLKPVLVDFFGFAFNNITFNTMRETLKVDIVSKDKLHLSGLLDARSANLFTIDGAVYNDLANFTFTLMGDTYAGIQKRDEESVTQLLNNVYRINYSNLIMLGSRDAYLHLNTIGNPYLYRGAKNKIPIRSLEQNYDYLMGPQGLYKHLPNIKPPKKH